LLGLNELNISQRAMLIALYKTCNQICSMSVHNWRSTVGSHSCHAAIASSVLAPIPTKQFGWKICVVIQPERKVRS